MKLKRAEASGQGLAEALVEAEQAGKLDTHLGFGRNIRQCRCQVGKRLISPLLGLGSVRKSRRLNVGDEIEGDDDDPTPDFEPEDSDDDSDDESVEENGAGGRHKKGGAEEDDDEVDHGVGELAPDQVSKWVSK